MGIGEREKGNIKIKKKKRGKSKKNFELSGCENVRTYTVGIREDFRGPNIYLIYEYDLEKCVNGNNLYCCLKSGIYICKH